jgi:hypothetical protein
VPALGYVVEGHNARARLVRSERIIWGDCMKAQEQSEEEEPCR